ncbi:hypothetical protein NQU17_10735 [Clostridiaceae bacterium HFYG-1003]|nr:hypothetical protein NQU17_10735 [Clostridiaceae bacterium HFYG-1003]
MKRDSGQKLLKVILCLSMVLSLYLSQTSIAFGKNVDRQEEEIQYLFKSKQPRDHIKAFEIKEKRGDNIFKSETNYFKSLQKSQKELIFENINNPMALSQLDQIHKEVEKYKDSIEEDKNKPVQELRNIGYSDEQIEILRTYDRSDISTTALSPNLIVYGDFDNETLTSTSTKVRLIVCFDWTEGKRGALLNVKDIFAVAWSNDMVPIDSNTWSVITYCFRTGAPNMTVSEKVLPESTNSNYITFWTASSRNGIMCDIDSGTIVTMLTKNKRITDTIAYASYGAGAVSIVPGFSIGYPAGAGISINFDYRVEKVGAVRVYQPSAY